MDPAKDEAFLYWVVDQVKELARDPKFLAEFEAWQRERARGTPHQSPVATASPQGEA